jgi:hypothetical protein
MSVYPDGTNARLIEVAAAEIGTIEARLDQLLIELAKKP